MKTLCLLFCAMLAPTIAAAQGTTPDTPPDKSTVFIYFQPGEGSKAFGADINIDHQLAVHLRKGVVFQTVLDPGMHHFTVVGLAGKNFDFKLEPGKETYLRLLNKPRALGVYAAGHVVMFELVTKDQGQLEIAQGALAPPDPKDLRPKKK